MPAFQVKVVYHPTNLATLGDDVLRLLCLLYLYSVTKTQVTCQCVCVCVWWGGGGMEKSLHRQQKLVNILRYCVDLDIEYRSWNEY